MNGAWVLANGRVWTGDSFARSVVIRGTRIESVDGPVPADAKVLDLAGRLVVPGFVDNHLHFAAGSLQRLRVELRGANSADELARRVAAFAAGAGPETWITGTGWDEQLWTPPVPPTRALLDRAAPHHPVFVTRLDLHMGVASSLALRLAGITRETPDPSGGTIVRDANGEPTGLLKDAAMERVLARIPPPARSERAAAMRAGLREAARLGVTAFCDMGMSEDAFDDVRVWQMLDREGALTARVWMYLPAASWERVAGAGVEKGFGSARLRVGGVKGFADGSLGSSTAAFHEPFAGEPGNRGLLMPPMLDGSMARWIAGADASDLQLAIHAIGDRAVAEVLAMFESRPDTPSRRFRIEHAQHLDASLVRRIADAGIVAAAQPAHAADDGCWAETRIGARRTAWAFPFRALLDAGALVTFGSDWPVATLDPIAGIHAAVTRRTRDGRHPDGWVPEQRITVAEALRCYTSAGARGVFAEREIGRIAPGMRADLAVLSADLFAIEPEAIDSVRVDLTVFGGRVVYDVNDGG